MNRKQIAVVTLLSLILVFPTSGLATGGNPHQGTLTIHLVLDLVDAEGYHAMSHSIVEELAKIGITVVLDYRESAVIFDTIGCTGSHWNYTWDEAPNLGWDLGYNEFWGMPTDLLWFPGMLAAVGTCPYGWVATGYNNTKADELLMKSFQELELEKRREYMLMYQEELVHDPPVIQLYAYGTYEVSDARLQTTWDTPAWIPAAWSFDPFLYTWVEDPMPEKVVVKWGDNTDLWGLNPFFMYNYAQDITQCFTHSMLYAVSKTPDTPIETGYITKPILATGPPVWDLDKLTADVYLRDDMYWHEFHHPEFGPPEFPGQNLDYGPYDEKFTADDVVMTFEALMDTATKAWGRGDYVDVLNCTEEFPGGVEKINDYQVRFHLLAPYAPFETLMANEWGAMIIPDHILGGVPHGEWYRHWTNKDCPPPGTGPHQWVEWVPGSHWKIEANLYYPEALGGKHPFDEIIFKKITEPAAGWIELKNHDIHFGDCWEATQEQLDWARTEDSLNVYYAPIPCVRWLDINCRHPILSNRYVRQAIAHAINYPHIVDDILPLSGTVGTLQAGAVWPMMEWAFHEGLMPEYNITKALMYMDMWKYSTSTYAPYGTPEDPDPTGLVAQGPLGDFDFSGRCDGWDLVMWADHVGTATDALPWSAGHDIDSDANNDEFVDVSDFPGWADYPGYWYPERSKTWQWSK